MASKKKNYLLKFKKDFKKLKNNIFLKNFKLLFKSDYDVIVFGNFNFYNQVNTKIFKNILENLNIKNMYIKSDNFKFFLKNNIKENFFVDNSNIAMLKNNNFNISNNIINLIYFLKSSFSKNFNIILFLKNEDLNTNILETLKNNSKFDPIYIKYKTHASLISYDYWINSLLRKEKNIINFKPLSCNIVNYHNIRILKILKIKNELNNNSI